ncbi:MAG: hypothetical protein F6J95_021555 [Leptolyngbya sp. SIO1E4]|nr:hypothetical protein [Leptolyngbya sp. SIO1E4]
MSFFGTITQESGGKLKILWVSLLCQKGEYHFQDVAFSGLLDPLEALGMGPHSTTLDGASVLKILPQGRQSL